MPRALAPTLAASTVLAIIGLASMGAGPTKPPAVAKAAPEATPLTRVDSATCQKNEGTVPAREVGDPEARAAAQRGLDFLAESSKAWQTGHKCYGCHVQAVTLDGMAMGRKHKYRVTDSAIKRIVDDLLTAPGGARTPGGLRYAHGGLLQPSKAFGGAAFARYDAFIDRKVADDLHTVATELLAYQDQSGRYDMQYTNPPVAVGDIQGTWLAIRTWKQLYERTANDKWLTAIQKAEDWVSGEASRLSDQPTADIQQLDYALMGLVEAGVGASETLPSALRHAILKRQNQDGGWALQPGTAASHAFATGQALYALRMAGMGDDDPAVSRGTRWLVKAQNQQGGWSTGGSSKAEAMWGVLGLVSLDVLSVAFEGLEDGQHVDGEVTIRGRAQDNSGAGVTKVELEIDDVRVASTCGDSVSYGWDTRSLGDGMHTMVVSAYNKKGEVSRRRIETYTGNVFLTQTGTRFNGSATEISARDIAPTDRDHRVVLEVVAVGKDGKPGRVVRREEQSGAQGAVQFAWDGLDEAKQPVGGERFVARLKVVDETGEAVQVQDVPFVHESAETRWQKYGAVSGSLDLGDGRGSANTLVELVDDDGNVVAQTRSNGAGNYRFKDVEKGKYKVRVRKKGFRDLEAPVAAAPAEEASAEMEMMAE